MTNSDDTAPGGNEAPTTEQPTAQAAPPDRTESLMRSSDDRVIEVLHEIGEKDGRVFDNVALYVFEVDPQVPDRFARVRTYDRDRANVEEFWSQYPDVLTADVAGLLAPFLPKEEITSATTTAAAPSGGR